MINLPKGSIHSWPIKEEGWNRIILEGAAKSCFDPLTSENISPAWTISNVINNVLCLKHLFSVCHFCWVKRDCNATEHEAAKLSLSSLESFYFNKDNLPRALASICKAECPSFSVFEWNCSLSKKKKWRFSVNSLFYFVLSHKPSLSDILTGYMHHCILTERKNETVFLINKNKK